MAAPSAYEMKNRQQVLTAASRIFFPHSLAYEPIDPKKFSSPIQPIFLNNVIAADTR
jgi:hypothetical protein